MTVRQRADDYRIAKVAAQRMCHLLGPEFSGATEGLWP